MTNVRSIRKHLWDRLAGQLCWGVDCWDGSLTLNFGPPHLIVQREPRKALATASFTAKYLASKRLVDVRGTWLVWVSLAPGTVELSIRRKATQDTSPRWRQAVCNGLNGQRINDITIGSHGELMLAFDLGGSVTVRRTRRSGSAWIMIGRAGYSHAMSKSGVFEVKPERPVGVEETDARARRNLLARRDEKTPERDVGKRRRAQKS